MEYKTSIDWYSSMQEDEIMLEKYTEPKGFFRNTTGPLKVGEIRLVYDPSKGWFEDLLTEEYRVYYMGLLCTDKGMLSVTYRGEAPFVSIGDKRHNIPVEDRIKFLYESLSSNSNYNCLGIKYKDPDSRRHFESIFEINDISSSDSYEEQDSYAEEQLPLEEQGWFDDSDYDDDDDDITTFTIDDYIGI